MDFQIVSCLWNNGQIDWSNHTRKFKASSDDEALLKAKAMLFDQGHETRTPRLIKLFRIEIGEQEALKEINLPQAKMLVM